MIAFVRNNTRFYMNPMPPASNAFPPERREYGDVVVENGYNRCRAAMDTRSVLIHGCRRSISLLLGAEVTCLSGEKQADNEAKQAEDRAEDLDDEDLDESRTTQIISVRGSTTAIKQPGPVTYSVGSAASASAAPLPLMPTETPQTRLHMPTVRPDQNRAKPV